MLNILNLGANVVWSYDSRELRTVGVLRSCVGYWWFTTAMLELVVEPRILAIMDFYANSTIGILVAALYLLGIQTLIEDSRDKWTKVCCVWILLLNCSSKRRAGDGDVSTSISFVMPTILSSDSETERGERRMRDIEQSMVEIVIEPYDIRLQWYVHIICVHIHIICSYHYHISTSYVHIICSYHMFISYVHWHWRHWRRW